MPEAPIPWNARRTILLMHVYVSYLGHAARRFASRRDTDNWVMELTDPQASENAVNIVRARRSMVLFPKMLASLA